jgi:outer membrane protein assembly factor BamB
MKWRIGGVLLLLLFVTVAATQGPRLFTRPALPPDAMLERLNLTMAWHTRLPMNGQRDGLSTLQFIPTKTGFQLIVQTRQGAVAALDAETGDLLWQTQVGVPYWVGQPVAANSHALFVTRREYLYALDRKTGRHMIETVDAKGAQPRPGMILPGVPSGAPVADEGMLFLPFSSRITAFELPFEQKRTGLPMLDEEAPPPNLPMVKWTEPLPGLRTELPLLLSGPALGAVSPTGTFFTLGSVARSDPIFFRTGEPVAVPMGQYENFAYIGSQNGTVYALNMLSSDQAWRFNADAPIGRQPNVTARDVYVFANRLGLYRVDRASGLTRWLNRDAHRFLATNNHFVYAADPVGRLLVLDYFRGTTLGVYDLRDYTTMFPNELTDRIYLGANDGLIVCLRHRGQRTPVLNKLPPPPPPKIVPKAKETPPETPKGNGEQKGEPAARAVYPGQNAALSALQPQARFDRSPFPLHHSLLRRA